MFRSHCRVCAAILVLAAAIHAQERGVLASIAEILSQFEHKCAPAQCEALRGIVEAEAATGPERTLAAALLRVDHTLHPVDIPPLETLASDASQSMRVRTIATMLLRLVHMPGPTDRALLDELVSARPADDR